MRLIPIDKILANPWQTRIAEPDSEYIKELALDIAKNGLLQAPVGRKFGDCVMLAFGHNRLAAYRWLNDVKESSNLEGEWSSMPVEIRELTDEQMANMAWSENEKRRDVTPIERAKAIQKRLEDFKWTNREAAEALGIDHSTISNILRLLKLPEILQKALQLGEMTERQATALLPLYELPEFAEGGWYRKTTIIQDALNGSPSDKLRSDVERYIESYGKKLARADFKVNQLIPEGGAVYCGTCEACDKRFKNRNLCFVHECFEAKTKFVRMQYLKEASFLSGYPILDFEKGGQPTHIPGHQLEQVKGIKCQNLVLYYSEVDSDQVPGFPHAKLICEKRNNSCSCLVGLSVGAHAHQNISQNNKVAEVEEVADEGEPEEILQKIQPPAPASPTARDLEEAARQMRRDKKEAVERRSEILRLVEERLVQALKEDAVGVFYLIAHQLTYIWSNTELDLEECYQAVARKLASYPLVPSQSDSLQEMIESINDGLVRLGLEPISLEKPLMEVLGEDEEEYSPFKVEVCAQTELEE